MKLTPLFDRVILKPIDFKKEEFKGIIIPSENSYKPKTAVVLSVGNGLEENGIQTKMVLKPEDKVVFSSYAGIEFEANNETLIIIKQTDIIAIIND